MKLISSLKHNTLLSSHWKHPQPSSFSLTWHPILYLQISIVPVFIVLIGTVLLRDGCFCSGGGCRTVPRLPLFLCLYMSLKSQLKTC